MTNEELEHFQQEVLDLKYFEGELERARKSDISSRSRLEKQIDLLEDAIIIYHQTRRPLPDELGLLKFGFSKGYVVRLLTDKYGHTNLIPQSLLVQTFMRKLQDDLDRR